jgi:hypothetical protein
MKNVFLAGVVLLAVASCASSNSNSDCTPAGTYVVSYTRDAKNPGDCPFPNGLMPDTATVTYSGETASVSFLSISGACAGPVTSCGMSCKQTFSNGGTVQLSWTFDAAGVHGLTAMFLVSDTSGKTCSASWNGTGVKR